MANQPHKSEGDHAAAPQGGGSWFKSHKLRTALLGTVGLTLLAILFGIWSYVGHVAVLDTDIVTLEMALEALDQQRFEEARNLVNRLQVQPGAQDIGGSLFILGAAKAHQADTEWSVERQRATHLVAARYLQKAREVGVPLDRQTQLLFLLGRSLIHGNQAKQGISVLNEALAADAQPVAEIRKLLTEAYLNQPDPNLSAALKHNDALLADETLDANTRQDAKLARIGILVRSQRFDDARDLLSSLGDAGLYAARQQLLLGQIALAKAQLNDVPDDLQIDLVESALGNFREAERLDTRKSDISRQAMVMIGKCYELREDRLSALEQYEAVSNRYGDTAESIVAMLSKARLSQQANETDRALAGYRAVLETVGNPHSYMNPLMSLKQLREELLRAHSDFLRAGQFEQAMGLVEFFPSLFGIALVTELKAKTHVIWGESIQAVANDTQRYSSKERLKSQARYHFRAAGRAYQTLAELRFATDEYIDDLWLASENYFRGQSYTHTTLVLDDYLHYEARLRRAQALLRYGQSKLAIGKITEAIAALEECVEMHPSDPNIYAARVECAKAYLLADKPRAAEALLLTNLTGETLTPASNDWRDSLFLLGDQLHEAGKYNEAILKLEEAVMRYPNAPQTLYARYTIARSFHSAAEEPAQKAREAKTENERQKNRRLRDQNLNSALQAYRDVQRGITLDGRSVESELTKTLLRNCYMMQGTVLFQLRRYEEARKAYANVSTLYQHDPFVLESFVNIAQCWHRLNQTMNARQTIAQAKRVLERLPADVKFEDSTNFNRQQWSLLLDEMAKW